MKLIHGKGGASGVIQMPAHYSMFVLESMDDVRSCFPGGKADSLNWMFCSTSGVHGSYNTLERAERQWDIEEEGRHPARHITCVVLQPRIVCVRYGTIMMESKDDIEFIRGIVKSTLEEVHLAQEGNL